MANDLSELNKVLFETLRGVKDGTVKTKDAQTIVNVGNTIVNNAKVQLSAFKLTKGKTDVSSLGTNQDSLLQIGQDSDGIDRYDMAQKYADAKAYKNVPEAIADMGKYEFNKAVDKYILDGAID